MNAPIHHQRLISIGSTDAKRIMDGDWNKLYREITGEIQPEDLRDVFRVQLGIHTEPFHLHWLQTHYDWAAPSLKPRDPFTSECGDPGNPVPLHCRLDAVVMSGVDVSYVLELKHTHAREDAYTKALYYMPQIQHQLLVTGGSHCYFSMIPGNEDPVFCMVERDEEYIDGLCDLYAKFWWHIRENIAPEIIPAGSIEALEKKAKVVPIDGMRSYDMSDSNAWAQHAAIFLETREAAARFEQSKKEIKELVPSNGRECTGHGIVVKRTKAGALTIQKEK